MVLKWKGPSEKWGNEQKAKQHSSTKETTDADPYSGPLASMKGYLERDNVG